MSNSLNGIGQIVATFSGNNSISVGDLVKISGNGTISSCSNNDDFCGVVLSKNNSSFAVQIKGYMQIKKSGTFSLGYNSVVATSNNSLQVPTSGGVSVLVTSIDSDYIGLFL